MTAHKPNRSQSDNSASLPIEAESITVDSDPRTRRIVQYLTENGSTTGRDIAHRAGWTLEETETHLGRLEAGNYVQLIGEPRARIVLLTERGEQLARDRP
jgi:DNA-binding MarR family transcriptional regulator